MENKKAIVFAGGGSKGAYQLGVWKALNELGESFQIATGTSIGAINAAFYVQGDYTQAEKMWNEITAGDIMANGINFDVSFESIISQRDNLLPFIKNYFNTKSADNTPFINLLQNYFDADHFFSSPVDYALMTVQYKGFSPQDLIPVEIKKSDMAEKPLEAWKWIQASASCYPVFPPAEIESELYIDGGFYDNIPIASAFKLGAQSVVAVDLNTENNHEGYIRHPLVTYIKPSKDLGNFMNFGRNVLDRSVILGYNDTMKVYGKYLGYKFTFVPEAENEEKLSSAAHIFLNVLDEMEANFDFSQKVRYHRVNKLEGCTTILGRYCEKYFPTEKEIFISAFELLLRALSYDDEKVYDIDELLYYLKNEADRIYPLLEFDTASAFSKAREFISKFSTVKNTDFKKYDEDRLMLIYTSMLKALQRMKI